ncbi:MAG TPA: DegT/DnrJ/EryC1/StrS family aminotransferase [Candidatus Acidoferrum sp.]|nr:DegT/DnrJ/EryC1/StrS family aminotransferase [Candidatus Acidoferrum sp.]
MPVETISLPAIAGGHPIFDRLLPIAVPEGLPNGDFLRDVQKILESGRLTSGPFVRELEAAAEAYLNVPHCVAVSNCTAALMLLLRVLNLRGEVILPSFTFHATAHAIAWNGLRPVFADCDPNTFCLDPQSVRERASKNTAAILVVHMFGNPAPVEQLEEIARDLRVPLVYDAAHALGTSINGVRVGGFGVAEVFSFSPTKVVVAGEGGLITTRDAALARRLRTARNYGDSGDYDPDVVGFNGRMTEFQAALALRGMAAVEARIARRNQIRLHYERRLKSVPGLSFQQLSPGAHSASKDFSVIVDERAFGRDRQWLFSALEKENIGVRRYFWPPVHRQKLYREVWDGRPLPVTEHISDRVLSLPIYSSLRDADVDKVCDAICRAADFARRKKAAMGQSA